MASIINNVGTFINLTNGQKETLELYASGANMKVEHKDNGESTIIFPDNTYLKPFMMLCKGFNQNIKTIKGTETKG